MAELYLAQKTLLMQFSSEDPEVASLLRLARQALEIPDFSLAEEILNEASQQDQQAAQNLPQSATTRLTSAAIAQNTNGNLQVVQLSFVKAQAYYRKALTLLPSSNKEYRGNVLVNLANAIAQGGIGIEGENIQNSLRDAVATYRLALTLLTEEEFPQQWASTQRSLGIALSQHGERTTGAESTRLHQAAETAYREALTVYTKEQFPQDSALTQGLLGSVLANQGFRPNGEAGAQLFAGAVQAYREALTINSKDRSPQEWAMIQNSLGKALADQGFRVGGETGKELLHHAIDNFELALEVWTREAFPVQREETMSNLKIVKKVLENVK